MSIVRIDNSNQLKLYFEALVAASVKIKSFEYGGARKILEREQSNLDSPWLWLELPNIGYSNNETDALVKTFDFAIVIAGSAIYDNFQDQEAMRDLCEQIIEQVILKIANDFSLDETQFQIEPVTSVFNDNNHGWKCDIKLQSYSTICLNTSFWN